MPPALIYAEKIKTFLGNLSYQLCTVTGNDLPGKGVHYRKPFLTLLTEFVPSIGYLKQAVFIFRKPAIAKCTHQSHGVKRFVADSDDIPDYISREVREIHVEQGDKLK